MYTHTHTHAHTHTYSLSFALQVNGESTKTMTQDDMMRVFGTSTTAALTLAPRSPGEALVVTIRRSDGKLGLVVQSDDEGRSYVTDVVEDTPAAAANIPRNSRILAVSH